MAQYKSDIEIAQSVTPEHIKEIAKRAGFWGVAWIAMGAVIGLISILVARIPRIPITVEKIPEIASLHIDNLLRALFPFSA